MKRTFAIILASCLLAAVLGGCGAVSTQQTDSGKPVVAVTIVPEETFVKKVCGDLVDTIVVVPPGYSPESYEPSPVEMAKFSRAEVYFTVGVPVESASVLSYASKDTEIVSLADACAKKYDELQIDGGRDPHIWLSPKRAVVMVQTIADKMSSLDPANSDTYEANAEDYIAEIQNTDSQIIDLLSGLESRSFIVFHPAFGYFAADYDLQMYSLEKNGKEATATELAEMVDFAKENGIKTIFYQAEIDSSQSEAFAEEIGGNTVKLDPLSADYTNNLLLMAQTLAEGMSK